MRGSREEKIEGVAPSRRVAGLLLSEQGRTKEAVEILSRFATSTNPDLLNAYGIALADLGQQREVVAQFQKALTADPINATAFPVKIDPRQYDALFNIGLVSARAGNRADARQALDQFVKTAPPQRYSNDIATARQALQALEPPAHPPSGRNTRPPLHPKAIDFHVKAIEFDPNVEKFDPEVEKFDPRVKEFDPKVKKFDPRVKKFDPKVEKFDPRVKEFDPRVEKFDPRVKKFDPKVENFDPKVEKFIPKVEKFDSKVEKFDPKVESLTRKAIEFRSRFDFRSVTVIAPHVKVTRGHVQGPQFETRVHPPRVILRFAALLRLAAARCANTHSELAQLRLEEFRKWREQIPHFAIPDTVDERRRLTPAANVPPQFVELTNVAVANQIALVRADGLPPAEVRDLMGYANSYDPLADELEAVAQYIRYSNTAARNLAGNEALTTYSLAQRLSKQKRYGHLRPHVADMRRALGRQRKPTAEEAAEKAADRAAKAAAKVTSAPITTTQQ